MEQPKTKRHKCPKRHSEGTCGAITFLSNKLRCQRCWLPQSYTEGCWVWVWCDPCCWWVWAVTLKVIFGVTAVLENGRRSVFGSGAARWAQGAHYSEIWGFVVMKPKHNPGKELRQMRKLKGRTGPIWRVMAGGQLNIAQGYTRHGPLNLLTQGTHATSASTRMACLCSKSSTTGMPVACPIQRTFHGRDGR